MVALAQLLLKRSVDQVLHPSADIQILPHLSPVSLGQAPQLLEPGTFNHHRFELSFCLLRSFVNAALMRAMQAWSTSQISIVCRRWHRVGSTTEGDTQFLPPRSSVMYVQYRRRIVTTVYIQMAPIQGICLKLCPDDWIHCLLLFVKLKRKKIALPAGFQHGFQPCQSLMIS